MQDAPFHSETLQPQFVHLRCHSEFSIVDGIVRIDDYIDVASKDSMPAVALTDLSNLFGAIKFYKAARGRGIKPILGCELWLENTKNRDQAFRLLLLVQNNADIVLKYQPFIKEVQPFILVLATPYMLEQLIKFGHGKSIMIDATFGSNKWKFSFDDHLWLLIKIIT